MLTYESCFLIVSTRRAVALTDGRFSGLSALILEIYPEKDQSMFVDVSTVHTATGLINVTLTYHQDLIATECATASTNATIPVVFFLQPRPCGAGLAT